MATVIRQTLYRRYRRQSPCKTALRVLTQKKKWEHAVNTSENFQKFLLIYWSRWISDSDCIAIEAWSLLGCYSVSTGKSISKFKELHSLNMKALRSLEMSVLFNSRSGVKNPEILSLLHVPLIFCDPLHSTQKITIKLNSRVSKRLTVRH